MQTLVEIGPSNALQGQHRRKDATEQIEEKKTWVRVQASVIFFICSVASFLLCCPCEALEGRKRCLYHNDLNNYRPLTKPCFIAKILEKLVLSQVSSYLNSRNLHNTCQSAYRQGHSTETALLSVVNDLFLSLNKGNMSVLALLDFSSALTSWIILSMNTVQY